MNQLPTAKRIQIVSALVEGNSIRATCRMTGAAKGTVLKLLLDLGAACAEYQEKAFRDLPCRRIECDEIWSFVGMKDKNVPQELRGQAWIGDVYTWTAICADTKLVPSWRVGRRGAEDAHAFMQDLASRLAHRVQLTTDGHGAYLQAVEGAFGLDVDYAQLVKTYGYDLEPKNDSRYSPPKCNGSRKNAVSGNPDPRHVSTSYVERQNLTMRMNMRRFTRLTNAFSKRVEHLRAAVALHFMHYNFCRVHQTLKTTPAMKAGVANWPWTIEEVIQLLDGSNSN